ncbi:MAG: NAD(P)H-dependent oxidoreductase [Pseudomonadales bacterium]|nr:NAD(P)H-dependent oxidoreductase [Pseudomonadales bacterium]
MGKTIVVIEGHPDPDRNHLGYALTEAYRAGAEAAGHNVETVQVATLEFPLLRTQAEFEQGAPPACIETVQQAILRADHLLLEYPLWAGTMPALVKGFIEQVFRPGFAIEANDGGWPKRLLKGKSARIVVTMGMPAFVYRWYFGAHSLKSLERNVLGLTGVSPIRECLIGGVDSMDEAARKRWLDLMHRYGTDAA